MHEWLTTAAAVPGFIGFAVGRTDFWEPLVDWRAKKITREAAVAEIARRYVEFTRIFDADADVTARRPRCSNRFAPQQRQSIVRHLTAHNPDAIKPKEEYSMQLGMIGLGRMGANMVRRLIRDGHECVVFDMSPKAVEGLAAEEATGVDVAGRFRRASSRSRARSG